MSQLIDITLYECKEAGRTNFNVLLFGLLYSRRLFCASWGYWHANTLQPQRRKQMSRHFLICCMKFQFKLQNLKFKEIVLLLMNGPKSGQPRCNGASFIYHGLGNWSENQLIHYAAQWVKLFSKGALLPLNQECYFRKLFYLCEALHLFVHDSLFPMYLVSYKQCRRKTVLARLGPKCLTWEVNIKRG